jgi:pimeloyl-ACP methyl ester carboxylesterase
VIAPLGRALHGEVLKLKRTLALRMIFVAPVLAALLGVLVQSAVIAHGRGDLARSFWESHSRGCLTIWAVFLMPLLITLETALLCGIEHAEKQWKHIFVLPLPRYAVYWGKFLVAQGLILASTLVACLLILLSGWLLILAHPSLAGAGPAPVWPIVGPALQCWLAAGLILSANLWIALRWPNFTVVLGAGIAGTFFALFAQSADASLYYPWLFPANALLGGERAATALLLGAGGGILIAILGCIDFVHREESAPPALRARSLAAWALMLASCLGMAIYANRDSLTGNERAHTVLFVPVDKDVRLEVLDWGGSGTPLVLLSGLGDTAHVYDKFAPKLTGNHHVYGITRRGFGASSAPSSGYSADRLGDDVLAVIEALKLDRPVLIGHSIAGEELSSVGSRHPEKIAGLVYLDAAYSYAYYDSSRGDLDIDLAELQRKLALLQSGATSQQDPRLPLQDVLASLPGFERVLRERLQDLEALWSPDQSNARRAAPKIRPGFAAAQSIMAGERKYSRIAAPILAIFALPHDMGPASSWSAATEARDVTDITGPQANAFERGQPSARVVRLPHADHYIFQSNEADVLREINAFLRSLSKR